MDPNQGGIIQQMSFTLMGPIWIRDLDGQRNAVAHDVKPTRPLLRARIVKGRKSTKRKLKNIIFSSKKTWPPETKPE